MPDKSLELSWVKQGVADTLAEVPADQVILGVPFYTRVWALTPQGGTDNADESADTDYEVSSQIYGMSTAETLLASNNATKTWNI